MIKKDRDKVEKGEIFKAISNFDKKLVFSKNMPGEDKNVKELICLTKGYVTPLRVLGKKLCRNQLIKQKNLSKTKKR